MVPGPPGQSAWPLVLFADGKCVKPVGGQQETVQRKQMRLLPDVALGSCHLAALIHFHSAEVEGTVQFTFTGGVTWMGLEGEDDKGEA